MKTLFFCFLSLIFLNDCFGQADSLEFEMKDTLRARELLEDMRILVKERKFSEAKKKGESAATIYDSIGVAYSFKGEHYQGNSFFERALEIRLKVHGDKHLKTAKSYNNLGVANKNMGEYDESIKFFQKSLDIRLEQLKEEHSDVATSYDNLGVGYALKEELDQAVSFFEKGLKIRLKVLGEKHPETAKSYSNLGITYKNLDEYDKSIDYLQKALNIRREQFGEEHPYVASSYNILGDLYEMRLRYKKALKLSEKALNIRLKTLGKEHPEIAFSYSNIGIIYYSQKNYEKAIEFFQKELFLGLKTLSKNHPNLASPYNNLGNIYADMGELDKAINYYKKALIITKESSENESPTIASFYNNLGLLYFEKNDYSKAKKFYQDALKIGINKFGGEHTLIAHLYSNLGDTYVNTKNYGKAVELYNKSINIRIKKLGNYHTLLAHSYNELGKVYYLQKQYENAEDNYKLALISNYYKASNFDKINSYVELLTSFKGIILLNKSRFKESGKRIFLEKANNSVIETLLLLNYLQKQFSAKTDKLFWQKQFYSTYEEILNFSFIDNNEPKQRMLTFAEKTKANFLQSQIQEFQALSFSNIPDTLLQKEYDLRIDITYYDKKRQEKLTQGLEETDTTVLKISSELFDLNQEYEALKKQFETDYPDYYKLKYDLSTVSLDYVQDTLLSPNQTLLEYFVGDSSLFLFVVKPDDYQVIEVKKDFPLEDWIKDLQQGISGAYGAEQFSDKLYRETLKKYVEVAPKLYDKLIAPVAKLLTEEVILIPDGVLGYVPFEALLKVRPSKITNFNSYPFLVKDHRFSYCYSATLLREMMDKKHKKQPSKSLLAFAPFYEGSYEKLNELFGAELDTLALSLDLPGFEDVVTRKTFKKLPHSGEEVFAAKKIWEGDVFLNHTATEDKFNQISDDYRIIHLSTHGIADSRVGDYSYLAFAEQKDSIENEYLYVRDLYNLQLNADLVVLSACETATGELQRGEGIISLARAFAYAGAKSILTTLWVVDDATTKELTKEFYLQLKKGNRKDVALRKAKLKMLKKGKNKQKHPFFWAAMIPVGDMRPLK